MSKDNDENPSQEITGGFPSEVEMLEAGYVRSAFSGSPDVSGRVTAAGSPFPTHEEIIQAGYVPLSRRTGRLRSNPRVGQMFWVDFPHDAYAPEFEKEHPGIIIRGPYKLQHSTCIVIPVSSRLQKAGSYIHQLSGNPNPKKRELTVYAVCDHIYTINTNRLRPMINHSGKPVFPYVDKKDMQNIFKIMESVLNRSFTTVNERAVEEVPVPEADPSSDRKTKDDRKVLTVSRRS
jgi:uncharacterized protein YifN (PemK superfamily)